MKFTSFFRFVLISFCAGVVIACFPHAVQTMQVEESTPIFPMKRFLLFVAYGGNCIFASL